MLLRLRGGLRILSRRTIVLGVLALLSLVWCGYTAHRENKPCREFRKAHAGWIQPPPARAPDGTDSVVENPCDEIEQMPLDAKLSALCFVAFVPAFVISLLQDLWWAWRRVRGRYPMQERE